MKKLIKKILKTTCYIRNRMFQIGLATSKDVFANLIRSSVLCGQQKSFKHL